MPIVMCSTVGLPPFVVIVSLLGRAALGGIVGAFLAVPQTASLVVMLERSQDRNQMVSLDSPSTDEAANTADRLRNESSLADSRVIADD